MDKISGGDDCYLLALVDAMVRLLDDICSCPVGVAHSNLLLRGGPRCTVVLEVDTKREVVVEVYPCAADMIGLNFSDLGGELSHALV